MANLKITDLGAFGPGVLSLDDDPMVGVDTSDTSMALSGTNKRLTSRQIGTALGINLNDSSSYQLGFGANNTQSNNYNLQMGRDNTQSGYYGYQNGYLNTQSGSYNSQSGYYNSQSAIGGFQLGTALNDGGFNTCFMFGNNKTAGIGDTAYFWVANGIRIQPIVGPPSGLEDGTIWITTAGTLQFRANGVTRTVTAT